MEGKTLPTELCEDCKRVLERVGNLERGSQPWIQASPARADPEPSKSESFDSQKQFEESEYYRNVLEEDDSLQHRSVREDLLESAISGCHLCRWLLNSLDSRTKQGYSRCQTRFRKRSGLVQKDPSRSVLGIRCVGHYHFSLRCAPTRRDWPVYLQKTIYDPARRAYQDYVGDENTSLIIDSLSTIEDQAPGYVEAMSKLDKDSPNESV